MKSKARKPFADSAILGARLTAGAEGKSRLLSGMSGHQ
jgi:hypothetical protein